MGKKDKFEKQKNGNSKQEKPDKKKEYLLTLRTKKWIKGTLFFLVAVIITLSFFDKAGLMGQWLVWVLRMLLGDSRLTVATIILSLFAGGIVVLRANHKKVKVLAVVLAISIMAVGVAGISGNQNFNENHIGLIGWIAKLLVNGFGLLVSNIIFGASIIIALLIFLQFIWHEIPKEKEDKKLETTLKSSDSPNFKIKGVDPEKKVPAKISLFKKSDTNAGKEKVPMVVNASMPTQKGKYALPPIDLLNKNETAPTSGNIKENSLIIKKMI